MTASICHAENHTAQIEYISPDGELSSLSAATERPRQTTAAFIDENTVSCALREGETTFIIALPARSPHDHFTFLNENATACGELKISVSNAPLPADSPKWVEVDGIVPFAHKRLFELSMLGVETKYVRLSFRVENPSEQSARLERRSLRVSDPFRSSLLSQAINSNLSRRLSFSSDVTFGSRSVAPLSAASRQ